MATYKVSNRCKKSVIETERWTKDGLGDLTVETVWRGGEFMVTPEGDEPVPVDGQDGIDFEEYANWELVETWDGCGTDLDIDCEVPEEERDRLYEKFEEDGQWFLEEEGWESLGCTTVIHGEIDVQKESTDETGTAGAGGAGVDSPADEPIERGEMEEIFKEAYGADGLLEARQAFDKEFCGNAGEASEEET